MTVSRSQRRNAQQDYNLKLRLERRLARKLVRLYNDMSVSAIQHFLDTQNIIDLNLFLDDYKNTLNDHYIDVAKAFRKRVQTKDVEITKEESDRLDAGVKKAADDRSSLSSAVIITNLQDDLNDSFAKATQESQESGFDLTVRALAASALSNWRTTVLARARSTVPAVETQVAAENTKLATVQAHQNSTDNTSRTQFNQIWVTEGDERVRSAHIEAEGQIQVMGSPFIVGGELLRYPGDTSLGASLENVINCRCSLQVV